VISGAVVNEGNGDSLISSAVISFRRHGKEPFAYLKDELARLPAMTNQDDRAALTPARWTPA
jgi:hypothetical protein